MSCPLCNSIELDLLIPREQIARELELRARFWDERIDGHIDAAEMKDRTDVLRGTPGEIRICRPCGILVRVDDAPSFECDPYADYVMEQMLRVHIDAFRHKEPHYRPLLRDSARVLEIGSYVGGFLHVATEWGWSPLGIDIGEDTARFSSSRGYPTRHAALEECAFAPAEFDAVFIWNTFEQIEDLHSLLADVHRILTPQGIVVIRTPNALFYVASLSTLALAYNNLLGFPHQYGFGTNSLDALLRAHAFAPLSHRGDTLIPPSRTRIATWARREANEVNEVVRRVADAFVTFGERTIAAPWIEAVYVRSAGVPPAVGGRPGR
jgi:2-polyprenyl-3-methyl-5-hydroxy-6-metoxy-1,4-benzoquinol methylase